MIAAPVDAEGLYKVGYLGPPASFTHEAARKTFPSKQDTSPTTAELISLPTIASVFAAVQSGDVRAGVVPFENSSNGSVTFTLDLFVDKSSLAPDLVVVGDAFVSVRHCLLGRRRKGREGGDGGDLSYIKTLRTHPQAWTQCTRFLESNLKHARRFDASSTSEAANLVSQEEEEEGKDGTSASISNRLAAEVYGLDILAEGIEDSSENTTRFLIITRKELALDFGPKQTKDDGSKRNYKTLLSFTVDHEDPGALARALAVFGNHGINLTSLNTRPSGERNWHYVFFVEIMGGAWFPDARTEVAAQQTKQDVGAMLRRRQDVDEGHAIKHALDELQQVAKSYKWMGCWKSSTA